MNELELKIYSRFEAETGVVFDLFATEDLKNFFINVDQLVDSIAQFGVKDFSEALQEQIQHLYCLDVYDYGFSSRVAPLDEIKLKSDVAGKIFPKEIYDAVKRQIPKEVITPDYSPNLVYCADDEHGPKSIYIHKYKDEYLISLNEINELLTGHSKPFLPALVFAVIKDFDIYLDNDFEIYYCNLDAVDDIFNAVGKQADDLKRRFAEQVFMTPEPQKFNEIHLGAKKFHSEPWEDGTFDIYSGVGFAMNKFFVNVDNLTKLLCDNDSDADFDAQDALHYASGEMGGFTDTNDKNFYFRLDWTDSIIKNYLALLWNGKNENNKNIERGWKFIRWFREFLPKFYKEYDIDFDDFFSLFSGADCFEQKSEFNLPPVQVEMKLDASAKVFLESLAERVNVDKDVLAQTILDLREKNFLNEQNHLRKKLYD